MPAAVETWLEIAGLTFHVVSEDSRLVPADDAVARPFFVGRRNADVELRARWTDSPIEPAGELLFDGGTAWQLRRSGRDLTFSFRSSAGDPLPYKIARFTPDFTSGDIDVYRPRFNADAGAPVDPLEYPLDELLMIHLLSQGRGVELHASGLLDAAGNAFVFAGQSGAGKSTLGALLAGVPGTTMLSDERLVLRTDGTSVRVYGTPWHGDALLVSARSGTLAGVFFLHHAATPRLVPVRSSIAGARLLACAFLPFHSREAVRQTTDAVSLAAAAVPCHELWFAPDASAVDLLTRATPSGAPRIETAPER
jgi:hypothetical protein